MCSWVANLNEIFTDSNGKFDEGKLFDSPTVCIRNKKAWEREKKNYEIVEAYDVLSSDYEMLRGDQMTQLLPTLFEV